VKPDEFKVDYFYVGRKSSYLMREIIHERSAKAMLLNFLYVMRPSI